MITFDSVTKSFKTDFWAAKFMALNGVSFNIGAGELVGFLGANGAGKTTSIKILMKFIRLDEGNVTFGNVLGKNMRDIFSNIGYFPERPYFYPHLTGREFLAYMGELNGVPHILLHERIKKWSVRFQVDHALDRKLHGYSKGMLQRMGFIASLIHDPKLLILDEPLSGLDPIGRKEIKDALVDLKKEGKTIFFSSHIVSDVEEVCQRVVVLEKGKLLYQGSIDKLIEDNIRPNYLIKGIDESGNSFVDEVLVEQRELQIKKIIENNGKILSVGQNRLTLEQIVYKIRK